MGSKKTTTVNQSTDNSIDPWVKERLGENYDFAKSIASTPFTPYGGTRFAGFNDNQIAGQNMLTAAGTNHIGSSTLQSAIDAARHATGYAPQQVTASPVTSQNLTDVDLSRYMNPYEQSVIDATGADLNMQRQREQNQNAASATRAGAWRGTQLGVTNALTNEAWDRNLSSTIANLRNTGYENATGLAEQDLGRGNATSLANADSALRAGLANQGAGLEANQQTLSGAQNLAGLSGQELNQAIGQASLVSGVGDAQQAQAQQGLDFNWDEFMRQLGYPAQQLALRNSALGLIPAVTDSTVNGTTTQKSSNPLGVLGSLIKLGSVLAAPFTGGTSLAALGAGG